MKSPVAAFALGAVFGVFGLLYTSIPLCIILFVIFFILFRQSVDSSLTLFLIHSMCAFVNLYLCIFFNREVQEKIRFSRAILAVKPLWNNLRFQARVTITREVFNLSSDGREIGSFILTNALGMEVRVCEFGARVYSLTIPNKNGMPTNICPGFTAFKSYQEYPNSFGATIGLLSDNIGYAVADILSTHLWKGRVEGDSILLECLPMRQTDEPQDHITIRVRYQLIGAELRVNYHVVTNKKTPIDISHRLFVNLSGVDANIKTTNSILDTDNETGYYIRTDQTLLTIPSDSRIAISTAGKSKGTVQPVENTDYDYRTPKPINYSNKNLDGYYILSFPFDPMVSVVRASSVSSGISLAMYTDESGVQISNCRFLNGKVPERYPGAGEQHIALCIAAQKSPVVSDRPELNAVVLQPGEEYLKTVRYVFDVQFADADHFLDSLGANPVPFSSRRQ